MGSQARAAPRWRDPGPAFGRVSPEVMEETLIHLAAKNEQTLSELPAQAGCFKAARIVEFIFLLSEKWHLDQLARYQAVELLERFMIKQVEQISKCSREKIKSRGQGSSRNSLKDQIYDTFVLRLVSCIQLASKLSLHYNIVNSDTALKFLQSLKYSYTKQELLESELAVLKTLHFQINVSTPVAYVELLLEVLGHNGCLLPAKPLHQVCMQLLDFFYLTRDTIYDTLLKIAIENSTPSSLQVAKFLTVKEDFMLLAVGIISTSVFILNPEHWKQVQSLGNALALHGKNVLLVDVEAQREASGRSNPVGQLSAQAEILLTNSLLQVVEHLNCITGITSQSILEFSYAVLDHILGSTTPRQRYGNCGTKVPENYSS